MTMSVQGIDSEPYLFHNTRVNVYRKTVKFRDIGYWQGNLRTLLAFDVLQAATGKKLSKLSLEEVTRFLVTQRPELKLGDLARSIQLNGVRVPLILLDDGTLLDGNRRFFACSHIYNGLEGDDMPDVLCKIPAMIIKEEDIDSRMRHKILAEANFVSDFKVSWTVGVKARVISAYFQDCLGDGMTEEDAYAEIRDVYGLKQAEVIEYVESVGLSNEYIAGGTPSDRNKRREHVQGRFVYFWEFRNKACRGRGALDQDDELPEAKELFFKMIGLGRFKNMKQVEPMIKARQDADLWQMLVKSGGSKIDQVVALVEEERAIRKPEDKIRNFLRWLQKKAQPKEFTKASFTLLEKLMAEINKVLRGHL